MTQFDPQDKTLGNRQRPLPRERRAEPQQARSGRQTMPAAPPPMPVPPPMPASPAFPSPTGKARRKPAPLTLAIAIFVVGLVVSMLLAFLVLSWSVPQADFAGLFHAKPPPVKDAQPAAADDVIGASLPAEQPIESPIQPDTTPEEPASPAAVESKPEEPYILSRWQHFVAGARRGEVILYSNGRLNDPASVSTWTRSGDQLVLTWPNPGAPGGAWVDRCTVSPDGQRYFGSNQHRSRIEGKRISD